MVSEVLGVVAGCGIVCRDNYLSVLEIIMPMVGGKKYPYTKAGKAAAKKAAAKQAAAKKKKRRSGY